MITLEIAKYRMQELRAEAQLARGTARTTTHKWGRLRSRR